MELEQLFLGSFSVLKFGNLYTPNKDISNDFSKYHIKEGFFFSFHVEKYDENWSLSS